MHDTTICSIPNCTDSRYAMAMCERHYAKQRRLRRHRGHLDQIPIEPVVHHLEMLRARGWSWTTIAVTAKTSSMLLARMREGGMSTLRREKADRILAIRATWQNTRVAVPMTGTRRRLDALAWQGWSGAEVARRVGVSVFQFRNSARTGSIEARTAAAVARFFDDNVERPGPNPVFAKKSRTLGAVPAAAWDGDLDDPASTPDLGARSRFGIDLEDVDFLTSNGLSEEQVALRMKVDVRSIQRARERAAEAAREEAA